MFKIPTILTADELMDKAFHRAGKLPENVKIRDRFKRKKENITSKLNVVEFPSFDQVHKFEFELIDIILNVGQIRKSLGAIDWARKQVSAIRSETIRKLNQLNSKNELAKLEVLRKKFYGRVTSVLKQVSSNLEFLNNARNRMKKMPTIDPELITVVVAGSPNVGKSLVVKRISSAKPRIAKYPFTTKQLNLGHIDYKNQKVQVIDTPGLLDRSPEARNKIERQAIMALQYLADLIIFIIDPSEHCGYTIEEQNRLLAEVHKLFNNIEIIEVENKVDIIRSGTDRMKISALENQGMGELFEVIQSSISEKYLEEDVEVKE